MTYGNIINFVKSLNLSSGQSTRTNCPACGKKNTFSVSNEHGQLKWLCFRNSCGTRGIQDIGLTSRDIRQSFARNATASDSFDIPSHFVSPLNNDRCRNYMVNNHCMEAYAQRRADIRFDPKRNRAVFLVHHNGVTVDAVGRSLDGSTPKWWRYGSSEYPFTAGNHPVAVIVEDAASACAVSSLATGIALMGTNLAKTHLTELRQYDRLIVALDPDARAKAIKMQQVLNWYVPTSVAFIEDDLKYYPSDKIAEQLGDIM